MTRPTNVHAPYEETDVVVVGGGGSGLTAAIFARQAGARVILLEKHTELRGSTGLSIGSITATGTWHQKRAGIKDSPQAHFEDMAKFAGARLSRCSSASRLMRRYRTWRGSCSHSMARNTRSCRRN